MEMSVKRYRGKHKYDISHKWSKPQSRKQIGVGARISALMSLALFYIKTFGVMYLTHTYTTL